VDLPMNKYLTNKHLAPALAMVCVAPFTLNNAQAAATFNSYATVTYTINSINNLTNPSNAFELDILGTFGLHPDEGEQFEIAGDDGSATLSLVDQGPTALFSPAPISYSRTFGLNGSTNTGGNIAASYLALFDLDFLNHSATDSYNVDFTLSYSLSTAAEGDAAISDVAIDYGTFGDASFNGANFTGEDYIGSNWEELTPAQLSYSQNFNFNLAAEGYTGLSVSARIFGYADQPAAVPVPSALWLFASGLLAFSGIKKSKKTA
jgi:hypothetical protein